MATRINFAGNGLRVYRHDREDGTAWYTTSLTKKVTGEDGESKREYGSIEIRFPKGTDIPDKALISFSADDAWMSFYKKEKTPVFYIFCNKFTVVDAKAEGAPILNTVVKIDNSIVFENSSEDGSRKWYNTSLSKKKLADEGAEPEYEHASLQIRFANAITPPANQDRITVPDNKAFLTFYKNKENKTVLYIVCTEYSK